MKTDPKQQFPISILPSNKLD